MTIDDATQAITDRFASAWPALEPNVQAAKWAEDFERPYSATGVPGEWVLIEVRPTLSEFASIGAPASQLVRRHGLIWISGFVPIHTGVQRSIQLCRQAASIFEGQDFDGVTCDVMTFSPGASDEDGVYEGLSGSIPYYFDEVI